MGPRESPPSIHFSIDDVIDALLDVSRVEQDPLLHPFWYFLENLHQRFHIPVDLYLFYETCGTEPVQSLANVSSRLRPWFRARPWIRFGPHAVNKAIPPHSQSPQEQEQIFRATYAEIDRFAGLDHASHWVRLHFFSESYELAPYFRSMGVTALLTTDKPAVSYRLPAAETVRLREKGRVDYLDATFIRSHLRIESLVDCERDNPELQSVVDAACPTGSTSVVFTHEYELDRANVRQMTEQVLGMLYQRHADTSVSD